MPDSSGKLHDNQIFEHSVILFRDHFFQIAGPFKFRHHFMVLNLGTDGKQHTRRSLQLATEHFKMVYGSVPGAFEALNPLLTGELESVSSAAAPPAAHVAPADGIGGPVASLSKGKQD